MFLSVHRNEQEKVIPVIIWAAWTITKSFSNILEKHEVKLKKQPYWALHMYSRNYCCKSTEHLTSEITLHVTWIVTVNSCKTIYPRILPTGSVMAAAAHFPLFIVCNNKVSCSPILSTVGVHVLTKIFTMLCIVLRPVVQPDTWSCLMLSADWYF